MPTAAHGLQQQLLTLFLYLGPEWILWLLMLLSVVSIAIALERLLHFRSHGEDVEALRLQLEQSLAKGAVSEVKSTLAERRSHVAQVLRSGVEAIDRGPAAMEEVLAGTTQLERLKMERGLAFLGTLGNNAPYIGLFGTVLGIIRAFRDLATNTIEGSQAVMAGIAEALVATAVGLLVALPAVAVFNAFQRKIRTQLAAADAMARMVLAHAKTRRE
jgi:biopolymer transport protein ExbB